MKKADIFFAVLSGAGVAWLVYGMIKESGIGEIYGIEVEVLGWLLFILLPILALLALWISYLIGKRFLFVLQVAKFLLIGILATLLDLGIFKSLGLISGLSTDWSRITFKGISFIGATFAKYWGNKFWAFEKSEMAGAEKELTQFYIITLIGLGVNVGIFSLIVNTIGPQFGIPLNIWETLGVIFAALVVATWNFLGYKFIVFKK